MFLTRFSQHELRLSQPPSPQESRREHHADEIVAATGHRPAPAHLELSQTAEFAEKRRE